MVKAVRTIMRGESLLSPAVTRILIGRHADRVRPTPAGRGREQLEVLAPREREVSRLIARGMSNVEIAEELVISFETVRTYVSRILAKLDLRDRVQAVVWAYRTGIVGTDD